MGENHIANHSLGNQAALSADKLFVNLTVLEKILSNVRSGKCCRVLGPRFRSKSKLMREASRQLHEFGAHYTSYQSLSDIQFDSEAGFYTCLFSKLTENIQTTESIKGHLPGSALEFQYALLDCVRKSARNVALFIDDLEIPPPNLVASLLGVLRAVYTITVDQHGSRLQAVVCGSLCLNQVALKNTSRFESISELILVDDPHEQECFEYVNTRCIDANLIPKKDGIQKLLDQTGRDPILIQTLTNTCFEQMQKAEKLKLTPDCVTEAMEVYFCGELDWRIKEIIRQVEREPSLLSSSLQILEQGSIPFAKLPSAINETPTTLDLCGVFARVDGCYKVKCELWGNILEQYLLPARVGKFYAQAGKWEKSIRYFGQAILNQQKEVVSELVAATINAINSINSQNMDNVISRSFHYLASGLEAAYPNCELRLYKRIGDDLEVRYPRDERNKPAKVGLDDLGATEFNALQGPGYSISSTSGETFILIPLRAREDARPIGLLIFQHPLLNLDPHRKREEILQLVKFTRLATQAIETKIRFVDLLDKLDQEGKIRERTVNIASGLIHDIYGAVANIPDLVDELEENLESGKGIQGPLNDLRKNAFETDRVSKQLKEFVISGQFQLKLADLESIIRNAIAKIEKSEFIQITYSMNGLNPKIWVDELWIELLLRNLLKNALEAIPGDRQGLIEINIEKTSNAILIKVQDNGRGIPKENIPYIFNFGFSTKNDDQMRGIGLYQCHQIAEVHKGELSVESEFGYGSVFTLKLPIDK